MEYYGYAGKILHIDLSSGDVRREPLDIELAKKFVGGSGIGFRLIYDLLKPDTDPLSPDSPIILNLGPLIGTMSPCSSKCGATMKFPVPATRSGGKHIIDTAFGGGRRFGAMLKNAGYDHIVITGRARQPSYLKIIDDTIEVCDASDLWGKADVYETTDELANRHKGTTGKAGVLAIGRAGENLVAGSIGFIDKMSTLGNGGGGALLGSKNLKAVVALGSKGVRVAKGKKFMALAEKLRQEMITHPAFGTSRPASYLRSTSAGYPDDLGSRTKVARIACISCPDPCKANHMIKDGRFNGQFLQDARVHYGPYHGRRLRLAEYGEILMLFDMANKAGMSLFTTIRMLHFVTQIFERGAISTKDTGGLVLKRGSFDAYKELLDKWVNRKDIGEYMAQGWYAISQKAGIDATTDWLDGTSIVRGFDTISDARFDGFDPGHALSPIVRPRGDLILQGSMYPKGDDIFKDTYWPGWHRSLKDIRVDCEKMGTSKSDIDRIFSDKDFNAGRLEKHAEDAYAVYNCLGACAEGGRWTWEPVRNVPLLAEIYSAATGFEMTTPELKKVGERVWNLGKLLNIREGFTRQNEEIPGLWLQNTETPLKLASRGDQYLMDWFGRRVTREDIDKTLDDYYEERGWDIRLGIPTQKKLSELGLEEFAGVIAPFAK